MIKHYIIISSAYSLGKRVALYYCDKDILQMDVIKKDINYIKDKCGTLIQISTHFIQMEEEGFDKVQEYDKFFEGVEVINTKEEFVDIILKDRNLSGIDVARYILTKVPCTHLKLEKLVYMCYADYLCNENKKLFNDIIYAYKYGPVIKSVYDKYKKNGYEMIDDKETYDEESRKLPIKSRLLVAEDGLKKIISINKTIEKYKDYDANELVSLTHKEFSPWFVAGAGELINEEITDELIKTYHVNETF